MPRELLNASIVDSSFAHERVEERGAVLSISRNSVGV
jgi:hypothetical protein